ncbi:porin [Aliivibrio finisterrensis]|uniref:Porin n=1 Tax=Aliivibrio finisterrensis TaxID=511998 RepID=A0A6N6RXE8_9GAMM|nr:porin [Aliivibrio finisterrensis]KAB2826456.1 porin [Aliivibrio finisterrensis]
MKKTLVALSVLAASTGSVQAFEIYNQDGVTVNMGGDIEVVYLSAKSDDDRVEDGDSTDLHQEIQDADIKFDVRYAVNDSLQFGGFFELQDTGTNTGDAYVALYSDSVGSIKVGRTCTALDDAGIGSDYQFGITTWFSGSDMFCGDEVIRWDLDKENFYATVALAQDKNNSSPNGVGTDETYFDARVGYRVASFDFTLLGGSGDNQHKHNHTLLGAEARFNGVENLGLAAAFYSTDNDVVKADTVALSATYQLDLIALATGVSFDSNDEKGSDNVTSWYVNAGYPIAPNTTAYVEVGADDGKTETKMSDGVTSVEDHGTGFAIGVKASF